MPQRDEHTAALPFSIDDILMRPDEFEVYAQELDDAGYPEAAKEVREIIRAVKATRDRISMRMTRLGPVLASLDRHDPAFHTRANEHLQAYRSKRGKTSESNS